MKKNSIFLYSILIFVISGCATTQSVKSSKTPKEVDVSAIKETERISMKVQKIENDPVKPVIDKPVSEKEILPEEEVVEQVGRIIAKTVFYGVLEKGYVRLLIESVDEKKRRLDLIIGNKKNVQSLPWETKTVRPGYFFLDLEEGIYAIKQIAIPVGSTMAEEKTDIRFSVIADKASYLGTLTLTGTKEKIKLGGVPVIKPGFEYMLELTNEVDEAQRFYQENYPEDSFKIQENLMTIRKNTNIEGRE